MARKPAARATPVADELDQIIWNLGRAYFAYVGLLERVLVQHHLDHVLRPGMGLVMFALFEKDSRTIKELAERSQLACSTLTGVLQRMEQAKLITRSRDAQDGRVVRVTLTPAARELESKCREVAHQMTAISDQCIGDANVDHCKTYLKGLTAAFRREEQRLAETQSSSSKGGE